MIPRTLFGKLLLLFLGFGALMGVAFLVVMRVSHQHYHQEFDQLANRHLAQQYVDANLLVREPPLTVHNFANSLTRITAINPDIDVYVVDARGEILASSAPGDTVVRTRVDLVPISRFLDPQAKLPLRGDDPTAARRRQVFSVAPLSIPGCTAAYLYIVLNRHESSALAMALKKSHAIGEGTGVLLTGILLAIAGSVIFLRLLTRRLGALQRSMQRFRDSAFSDPVPAAANDEEEHAPADEIERLRVLFGQLADRIHEQMRALHKTDEQRRELLTSLSHDLRTPLTTLQANLELLVAKESLSDEERRAHAGVSVQQCRRVVTLVEQMLELARLDARQVPFVPEPFQLAELAQDVVMKRELDARRAGVMIEIGPPHGLPLVIGDIRLIERVIDGLLDNAVRFAGSPGRVTVRLGRAGDKVRMEIHNTGPGIPATDRDRLFEHFFRGDKSRSTASGNAGLGLSIVRAMLDLHRSEIGFSSSAQDGTRFFFELDVAGPGRAIEASPSALSSDSVA